MFTLCFGPANKDREKLKETIGRAFDQARERVMQAIESGQRGEMSIDIQTTELRGFAGEKTDHMVNGGLAFKVKLEPLPQYAKGHAPGCRGNCLYVNSDGPNGCHNGWSCWIGE